MEFVFSGLLLHVILDTSNVDQKMVLEELNRTRELQLHSSFSQSAQFRLIKFDGKT